MGTDKDWEKWGATDPYFGVFSAERFRTKGMSVANRTEFFRSGESHVDMVIETIRSTFDRSFAPSSALDFGSGVGRLVMPMARRMTEVWGVDVSPSMISEATDNCRGAGICNVRFEYSDDTLSAVDRTFDLVHSYIVLQHIPWRRGRKILQALAERVRPGGYLAVQILTGCTDRAWIRGLVRLRYALPPINWLRNLVRARPIFEPAMQLHVYQLGDIVDDLLERRFGQPLCVDENLTELKFDSKILYARRSDQPVAA
jgi:2-polyprenyl-3-methyl-5-hydroxy-6-metoxy-1,4-benzoquinol methylase